MSHGSSTLDGVRKNSACRPLPIGQTLAAGLRHAEFFRTPSIPPPITEWCCPILISHSYASDTSRYFSPWLSYLMPEEAPMSDDRFTFPVTDGWLRDLASEPTPHDRWPCIRWDEQLLADQIRFLDVQAELGITYNLAWGLFVDRSWPVPLEHVIDAPRE